MKNDRYNEERLVPYLLGELSEAQQVELEEAFFTDEELFEQVAALEDELRYDYAQGRLTQHQRDLFEKRYLASAENRRSVEQAGAVLETIARVKAQRNAKDAPEPRRQNLRQALAALLSSQSKGLRFALAAIMLLLVATTGWFVYQTVRLQNQLAELQAERELEAERRRQQTTEDQARLAHLNSDLEREQLERARLEQELAKQRTPIPWQQNPQSSLPNGVLSFVLPPGGIRSEGEKAKTLVIPQGIKAVQLELQLRRNSDHRTYRAQLLTADGAEIWHHNNLQPKGRNLMVQILARLLADGDYELALKGRAANRDYEEADSYYFTIVKK